MTNSSVPPSDYELFTDESLSNITFTENDFQKIKRDLVPKKAQGHHMMSIRMLKICGDSIYKALGLTFRAC